MFFNTQTSSSINVKDRNTIRGTYDVTVDSFFSIRVSADAYKGTNSAYSSFISQSLNAQNNPVNSSSRINTSEGDNKSFNSSVLFRKKFRRVGRTLSLSINETYVEASSTGYLHSFDNFYLKTGALSFADTTDQMKLNGSINHSISGRFAFTQPLTPKLSMELDYGLNSTISESKLLSYNRSLASHYSVLDSVYSNDFNYNVLTNTIGGSLSYTGKKLNGSVGTDISSAHFDQKDLIKSSNYSYNYTNLAPRSFISYKLSSNKRISFNYFGYSRQPSIQQLQPVANNSNPLNISIGNPNLIQQFTHNLRAGYNSFNAAKETNFNFSVSSNIIANAIQSSSFTDSLGRTKSQFVNTDGNNSYGMNTGFGLKLKKLDMQLSLGYSFNISHNASFVNGLKNLTSNGSNGVNIRLSKHVENKYDVSVSSRYAYNTSSSSIRPDVTNNYWVMSQSADVNVDLPFKTEFNSEINMDFRQQTAVFKDNNNVISWDAWIAKKIFKGDKAQIRLTAHDILDQNKGYSRNISSTTVTENTYQTIRRYVTLSFVWNFNSNPAAKP